ncbi:hypothetical protein D3C72_2311320 [compost metagenome]
MVGNPLQDRVQHRPADVLEQDVHVAGRCRGKLLREVRRLVVHAGVEAELLDDIAALLRAPGDADHTATLQLRDLAHHAAHRT